MISNALRTFACCVAAITICGCGNPTPVSAPVSARPDTRSAQFLFELPLVVGNGAPWSRAIDPLLAAETCLVIEEPILPGAWKVLAEESGYEQARLRLPLAGGPFLHVTGTAITAAGLSPAPDGLRLPGSGQFLLTDNRLIRPIGEVSGSLLVDYPMPSEWLTDRLGQLNGAGVQRQRVRMQSERYGTLLPTPVQLTYQVEVPPGGRLEFAVAAMPLALRVRERGISFEPFGERTPQFRLRLEEESGLSTTLWERGIKASEAMRFFEGSANLSAWAGETVRLHLEAEQPEEAPASDGHALVAWAEPVLIGGHEDMRPNILVLVLDTLRADRLGCYGDQRGLTPVLDALAKNGVLYSDAMSAASWTLPSHASIFTSTYPSQHGLWNDQVLPSSLSTIAEVMHDAGYRTAGFAEGGYLSTAHGFSRGHELYDSKNRDCQVTFERAASWIGARKTPYYAFVHTYQVHSPYEPPAEFRERLVRPYSGGLPEVVDASDYPWGHGGEPPSKADQRYISDLYDAELAYLDREVGRFLDALEATGSLQNTLLLVTSDHGEEFFEHGSALHGMSLYQEQLHVPLILHWPQHLERGGAPAHTVHAVDIAPTLAAAAGVAIPDTWEGAPLGLEPGSRSRPLFVPMKTLWSDPKRVGEPAMSLREGHLKYIVYPASLRNHDTHLSELLFDLEQDPDELHNLLTESDAARWAEKLSQIYARYPVVQSGGVAEHDEATRAELQKLGYSGDE